MRQFARDVAGLLLLGHVANASTTTQVNNYWGWGAKGFCKNVRSAVTAWHEQSVATSFCASYLHLSTNSATVTVVPTSTITTSVTSTTGTLTLTSDKTDTVTVTTVTTPTVTTTSVATTTTTVTSPLPSSCDGGGGGGASKRDAAAAAVPTPNCWGGHGNWGGAELSSACSCLQISTGTTITHTAQASLTTRTIVVSTGASATATSVIDVTATVTVTAAPVTTTVTSQTLATATATGPFNLGISLQSGSTPQFAYLTCGFIYSPNCGFEEGAGASSQDDFYLEPDGNLYDQSQNALVSARTSGSTGEIGTGYTSDAEAVTCSLVPGASDTCYLDCSAAPDLVTEYDCYGNLYLGPAGGKSSCFSIDLQIAPIS